MKDQLSLSLLLFLTALLPMTVRAQLTPHCFGLSISSANGAPGDTVCVDIRTQDFSNVYFTSYSFQWDPEVLTYLGPANLSLPNMDQANFITDLTAGDLRITWAPSGFTSVDVPDGSLVLSLCFELIGEPGDRSTVHFGDTTNLFKIYEQSIQKIENFALFGGSIGIISDGGGPVPPLISGCSEQAFCEPPALNLSLSLNPDSTATSLQWFDAGGNVLSDDPDLLVSQPGRYRLKVIDSQGATLHGQWTVGHLTPFQIYFAGRELPNCYTGETGSIEIVADGGSGDFSFLWSNGDTSATATGLLNGDYTVTVTDNENGCWQTWSYSLESSNFFVYHNTECTLWEDGSSTSEITVGVLGGGSGPFDFSWSNGETDTIALFSTITVENPGQHTVTVTDALGCSVSYGPIQTTECLPAPDDTLHLYLPSTAVATSSNLCVPVRVSGFSNVSSLQLSLSWDEEVLQFDSTTLPGLPATWEVTFHQLLSSEDHLGFSAHAPDGTGLTLADGAVLFELCFTVSGAEGSSPVYFGNTPIPRLVNSPSALLDIKTYQGSVLVYEENDDRVILQAADTVVETGHALCLPVHAVSFTDVAGFQTSLEWDPAILRLDSILAPTPSEPQLAPAAFNTSEAAQGRLRLAWLDPQLDGASLPSGTTLYELCFTSLHAGIAKLSYRDTPIAGKAYTSGLSPLELTGVAGTITVGDNLVWPGDADGNGWVNHFDLLSIGLAHGAEGPERPGASASWTGQPAPSWEQQVAGLGTDYRHVDTDGNGRIEAEDTLALTLNWGATSGFTAGEEESAGLGDNEFLEKSGPEGIPVFILPDTILPGEPQLLYIALGEDQVPADSAYGLAFTLRYAPEQLQANSLAVNFANSWLAPTGPYALGFYRNDPESGRLYVSLTRTDGQDLDGAGIVATLHLTANVPPEETERDLFLRIDNVRLISSAGRTHPVVTPLSTVQLDQINATAPGHTSGESPRVFPVPARRQVCVDAPPGEIERLELFDLRGLLVAAGRSEPCLNLAGIEAGPYYLRVTTKRGGFNKKIVIID